jgi:predicted RNA binding protein YcfA (HicA-like mRNA interferase family)
MLFTNLSSERAIRAFKKKGFWVEREGKHTTMTDGIHIISIPRHRDINPYTLKTIIRGAGLTYKEFKILI